jgi:hypothetical protein
VGSNAPSPLIHAFFEKFYNSFLLLFTTSNSSRRYDFQDWTTSNLSSLPIADIEKNSFLTTTLVQKSEPAIQNRRKTTTLIFQIKIVVVLTHIEVSKLSPAKEKEDNNVGREYFSTHEIMCLPPQLRTD